MYLPLVSWGSRAAKAIINSNAKAKFRDGGDGNGFIPLLVKQMKGREKIGGGFSKVTIHA